jgi:hypothetical protein
MSWNNKEEIITCCLEPLTLGTCHDLIVVSISGIDHEVEEDTYLTWN